jgi:hypothetical protein
MAIQLQAHRIKKLLFLIGVVFGCASPHSWTLNTIATGDPAFDCSRLIYASPQAYPPMAFELTKMGDQVEGFIHLTRFRFTSQPQVKVLFTIEEESFENWVPVNEGAMRIRLLPETTQRLIQALQEGHKVAILIDGFEETLDPAQFSSSFAQFVGEGHFFQNLFTGAN